MKNDEAITNAIFSNRSKRLTKCQQTIAAIKG